MLPRRGFLKLAGAMALAGCLPPTPTPSPVATPTPITSPLRFASTVVSKLGIHSIGPRNTGVHDLFDRLEAAGRQIAIVKCRDDMGVANLAASHWPQAITIGAFTDYDGALNFDEDDWSDFRERARRNPSIRYWELLNEIDGEWITQADLYIRLMPRFEDEGWRLVMFNCATGTPHYPRDDGGVAYAQIARACAAGQAGGHIVGVHGYGFDRANELLRHRSLARYLIEQGARTKIALTEFGPWEGTFEGTADFMGWCTSIDPALMQDEDMIGGALWTLGGGWADYTPAMPALTEYLATVTRHYAVQLPMVMR